MHVLNKAAGKISLCFQGMYRAVAHLKHPISLPEDIGYALSFPVSNFVSTSELLTILKSDGFMPHNLSRFMQREKAELYFHKAITKDYFMDRSIFSYSFHNNFVEFVLEFDADSRLRRLYLRHDSILMQKGKELPLPESKC